MTIDEARTQLSAYLDGELDEPTRRAVEAALAARPELRTELEALRRTAELVRGLPRHKAPDGFADSVLATVQAPPRRSLLGRWRHVVTAAAACLVLGIAAWLAIQPRDGTGTKAYHDTSRGEPGGTATQPDTHAMFLAEKAEEGPPGGFRGSVPRKAAEGLTLEEYLARGLAGTALSPSRRTPAPDRASRMGKKGADDAYKHDAPGLKAGRSDAAVDRKGMARSKVSAELRVANGGIAEAKAGRDKLGKEAGLYYRGRTALGTDADRAGALQYEEADGRNLAAAQEALIDSILARRPTSFAYAASRESVARYRRGGEAPGERSETRPPAVAAPATPAPEAPAKPKAVRIPAPKPVQEPGDAEGESVEKARPPLAREIVYDDLLAALADVQSALGEANVAFAIQPLGSGHFVVEADMPAAKAGALLTRLGRQIGQRGAVEVKGTRAWGGAGRPAAGPAQPRPVHVVLHFRPGRATAPAAGEAAQEQRAVPAPR